MESGSQLEWQKVKGLEWLPSSRHWLHRHAGSCGLDCFSLVLCVKDSSKSPWSKKPREQACAGKKGVNHLLSGYVAPAAPRNAHRGQFQCGAPQLTAPLIKSHSRQKTGSRLEYSSVYWACSYHCPVLLCDSSCHLTLTLSDVNPLLPFHRCYRLKVPPNLQVKVLPSTTPTLL